MAGPLNVPQSQRPAIQELAKLTEEAYGALRKCMADGLIYSEPSALIEQTSKAVEAHTALGGQILAAVIGLRGVVDNANMSIAAVSAGVASDAQAKGYVPPASIDVLTRRLTELLNTPSVAISSKAYSLVVADAAPFSDVRIVSDVRPVFTNREDGLQFSGSVIVHMLNIEVGGDGKDQHSALTTSDLVKLRRTVDRALEKDRKLRDVLRGGPLSPLETSISEDKDK